MNRAAVAAAAAFTLLNAAKPLVVDDYAYVAMARHVSQSPLDPLRFTLFWEEAPLPADQHLLTPVVPYVLAPAVSLFPGEPFIWKLWLFPFALTLAAALSSLAARFAPSIERPFVLMLMFSPALLPAFNLMLDVPALALHLAAVCLFLAASDRGSLWRAACAGLVAGLGAQAKFTALAALPAIVLCSMLRRFWPGGAAAAIAAAAVFGSWEWFVWARYGHSMFITTSQSRASLFLSEPFHAGAGLVSLIGGLAPALLVLSLAACRAGAGALAALIAIEALVPIVIRFAPARWFEALRASGFTLPLLAPEIVLFLPLGAATVGAFGFTWWRGRRGRSASAGSSDWPADRWLRGWLLIEVVALAGMTSFLAARRLLGVVTVMMLLAARAAARAGIPSGVVVAGTALSIACGCFVWTVDALAARDTRETVEDVEGRLRSLGANPGERIWYAGHWSFQYYAEEKGWRPVVPGESLLRSGDWLVRPTRMSRQPVVLPPRSVTKQGAVDREPLLHLTTIPFYYVTSVPYGRLFGAQAPATIERVVRDVRARNPEAR